MASKLCKHGNRRSAGICPDCTNEASTKRARKLAREDFRRQIARIRGNNNITV